MWFEVQLTTTIQAEDASKAMEEVSKMIPYPLSFRIDKVEVTKSSLEPFTVKGR